MTEPRKAPKGDPVDDDDNVSRPRWLGVSIIVLMVLVVLGMLNVGWLIMKPSAQEKAIQTSLQADPDLARGKQLVEASSCMRCHMAARKAVGPSFTDVSARYRGRADALPYLAGKIRGGSVGEWGRIVMPRHPNANEADALLMARWVLSHESAKPSSIE